MEIWTMLKEQLYLQKNLRKFFRFHGYHADLENPRSFNEKIFWRKIFDRNTLFPLVLDKYKARNYVIQTMGKEEGQKILIPLLSVSFDPGEIPFDQLPEEYIVKPNHGSGWSIIVDKEHRVPRERIISQCRKWLRMTYGREKMEWAYSEIEPRIMVEKLLKDSRGRLASDFKFHVFGGKVEWVFVMHDRFGSPSAARYLRDFTRMGNEPQNYKSTQDLPKPENYVAMVDIAEKLAKPFDYIRVDLYNVDGEIFFGEFTIYPASGLNPMERGLDLHLGSKWQLDREHQRDL